MGGHLQLLNEKGDPTCVMLREVDVVPQEASVS